PPRGRRQGPAPGDDPSPVSTGPWGEARATPRPDDGRPSPRRWPWVRPRALLACAWAPLPLRPRKPWGLSGREDAARATRAGASPTVRRPPALSPCASSAALLRVRAARVARRR